MVRHYELKPWRFVSVMDWHLRAMSMESLGSVFGVQGLTGREMLYAHDPRTAFAFHLETDDQVTQVARDSSSFAVSVLQALGLGLSRIALLLHPRRQLANQRCRFQMS